MTRRRVLCGTAEMCGVCGCIAPHLERDCPKRTRHARGTGPNEIDLSAPEKVAYVLLTLTGMPNELISLCADYAADLFRELSI